MRGWGDMKCAISIAYLTLVALVVALCAPPSTAAAQSTFYRPSETAPYACELRAGKNSSRQVILDKSGSRTARVLTSAARQRKIASIQSSIRNIQRLRGRAFLRKVSALQNLRALLRILKAFPKTCAKVNRAACSNSAQDFFESGTDCGTVCGTSCSDSPADPTPTATPSTTPTPIPTPSLESAQRECFDGIDNNDDGLADFADPGCLGPNGQETENDYGFKLYFPSADTRIVYVSSSEGNDSNDGLSASTPKRTVVAGYDLIRDGYPDWLLLKRGDTFDYADWRMRLGKSPSADPDYDFSWNKQGRSVGQPMLIATYGNSTVRPLLKLTTRHGFRIWNKAYITLSGLNFYSNYCDPNSPDFQNVVCGNSIMLQYANHDIVIEDNEASYSSGGILVQSIDNSDFDRVQVRRNIVHHCYSGVGHAQGLYSYGPGALLIKENVFYHNGWNEDYRLNVRPAAFSPSAWQAVPNGRIDIQLNNVWYRLSGLNFSSVTSYAQVAQVIQTALAAQIPAGASVTVESRGSYLVLRSDLPSNEAYSIRRYTGSTGGTDIDGASLLDIKADNPRTPAATIFNRHMYLSHGYSNTTVEGNVTAIGASGSIQARMGGVIRDNLVLDEPVAISAGHAQNPVGVPFSSTIVNNVVLGSSNIGLQGRGFGLSWSAGNNSTVSNNIIAHNIRGTGNVEGLFAGTDSAGDADHPNTNTLVSNNIVYKWGGAALASRLTNFQNIEFVGNYFLQPTSGIAALFLIPSALDPGKLIFSGNTYQTGNSVTAPVRLFDVGHSYSEWSQLTGEVVSQSVPLFRDPERNIASYLAELDRSGGVDEFMLLAQQQSRFSWIPSLSAYSVNAYIREGFTAE